MARVLFLHGYGESTMTAEVSTRTLKQELSKKAVELLPLHNGSAQLSAGHEMVAIADPEYRAACESGAIEAYGWYILSPEQPARGHRAEPAKDFGYWATAYGQNAAIRALSKKIDAAGGVDGVIGFSQGGELAMLLAESLAESTSELSDASRKRLCFIATFGSEDPFTQRGEPPAAPLASGLHAFLSTGSDDVDGCADIVTAAAHLRTAGAALVETAQVAGLGHAMPEAEEPYAPMVALLEKAIAARDEAAAAAFQSEQSSKAEAAEQQKAPPATQPPMPTKPEGWGEVRLRSEFSGLIPEEQLRGSLDRSKQLVEAAPLSAEDEQELLDSFAGLQGCLTNNALASDLLLIDGAVDALKYIAGSDAAVAPTAKCHLARMGFEEYSWERQASWA